MVNAHILCKRKSGKQYLLHKFIIELEYQLMEENTVICTTSGHRSTAHDPLLHTGHHFLRIMHSPPDKKIKLTVIVIDRTRILVSSTVNVVLHCVLRYVFEKYHTILVVSISVTRE